MKPLNLNREEVDEDYYHYNFDQSSYAIENSFRPKSSNSNETIRTKSLAYYLDFYNKKHTNLAIESNQNVLSQNLKLKNHKRYNNQPSNPSIKSLVNSQIERSDKSYLFLSANSEQVHEKPSHINSIKNSKMDPGNFVKFNKILTDQKSETDSLNFKHLSNAQQKQFQQHKHLLTYNHQNQTTNTLMDYTKQEDRLTNNKYHYYIKHYLNSKNPSHKSLDSMSVANKTALPNFYSNFSNTTMTTNQLKQELDQEIDTFSNSTALSSANLTNASLTKHSLMKSEPQLNKILKSFQRKNEDLNKRAKPVDIKLNNGVYQSNESDSRLSFLSSNYEAANYSANRSLKENLDQSEQKYSQNRQFLERIQRVYNRKFKSSNKVNQTRNSELVEKDTNDSDRETDARQENPAEENKNKKNFFTKLNKHGKKNSVHPDQTTSLTTTRSNEKINFKFDSLSSFASEHYSMVNFPKFERPRVELKFQAKTSGDSKPRLNPLRNDFFKMEKLNTERSLIVNDFLSDLTFENLSESDMKTTTSENNKLNSIGLNQTNSLSVIDLADLDQLPRNNLSTSAFKPMRLSDYIQSSKNRQEKKLAKLQRVNKISEEIDYSPGYINPSNSVFNERIEEAANELNANTFATSSNLTMGSKKRVSFHERVLETDVASGNSVYKPIITYK